MTSSLNVDVSRETRDRLEDFVVLVAAWTKRINLISQGDQNDIWERHIKDSLQLSSAAKGPSQSWLDIGTGGGFPGMVLAILHAETRPDASHTFVESDQRKAAFLMTASSKLGLKTKTLMERSELAAPQAADVVTARAFAPLSRLLDHVDRHMNKGGQAILPKGEGVQSEITEARKTWSFEAAQIPSKTNPAATILRVTGVSLA